MKGITVDAQNIYNALPERAGDALGQLILDHVRSGQDSISGIARKGGMSRQTVSSIVHRTGPISVPRQETLTRLAQGLGMPLHVVEQAAAVAVASDSATDEADAAVRLAVLTGYAEGLPQRDLDILVATARAMASAQTVA